MNVLNMIISIVFVQTNQIIFNKLLGKVQNRDYVFFDVTKRNTNITIFALFKIECITFLMSDKKYDRFYESNLGSFDIKIEEKSSNDIIKELEEHLEKILNIPNEHIIVFLYMAYEYNNCIIMKNFIERLKKVNNQRKSKKKLFEFQYENICDMCDQLQGIVWEIKDLHNESNQEMSWSSIYYYFHTTNNHYCIGLRMDVGKFCFIFEFCIGDFFCLIDIESLIQNTDEAQQFKKLLNIYNLCLDKFEIKRINFNKIPIKCTLSKIEYVVCNKNFTIMIENEKIIFNYSSSNIEYYTEIDLDNQVDTFYISKNCFKDFQSIFMRMSNTMHTNGINFFYKILEYNNKREFFLERIINARGSALNIIFAHLLLYKGTIDDNHLDIMIGKNKDAEFNPKNLTKMVSAILEGFYLEPDTYLIKFCLLLEAEKYINENNTYDDLLFNSIKDFANVITSKNKKNENKTCNIEEDINLVNVFDEIIDIHIKYHHLYENEVVKNICTMGALSTGSNFIRIHNYLSSNNFTITKDDIISNYNFNASNIEKSNSVIIEKLKENIHEDEKGEEKINEILQRLKKYKLYEKLNNILFEGLVSYLQDKYNKKVRMKLRKRGINYIKKTYNFSDPKLLAIIDIDVIQKFQTKLIIKFISDLKELTAKNIKNICVKYLNKVIIENFKCEFSDDFNEKQKWKNIAKILMQRLDEKTIFNHVNNNLQLYNGLLEVLKKIERNK
ncbi:uncharacterized protein VNE69_12200 [Vairimorpha necatrix]|uniref:Uncharacterized protein n=1 Tax=Vairimorpha necatrix TaxID=6039 RepID=A0AAX4JGQ9_9MICR